MKNVRSLARDLQQRRGWEFLPKCRSPAFQTVKRMLLKGGVWEWVQFNRMFVAKSRGNFYSNLAQD